MKIKQLIMSTVVVVILTCIVLFLSYLAQVHQGNQMTIDVLKQSGIDMGQPPKEYDEAFANKIISNLFTPEEITSLMGQGYETGPPKSILFDYGDRGKLLSLQQNFGSGTSRVTINVTIEDPESTKLRYKIEVGTDYRGSEIIKKASTYPNAPFSRTFAMVSRRGEDGWLKGLSYYEGSIVHIDYFGPVNEENIQSLSDITWAMAKRHIEVYKEDLKNVSEGPLFVANPHLTRPDLPDPDLSN